MELRFRGSLADTRGGYFMLVDPDGTEVAGMWSDQGPDRTPGFTLALDTFGVLDNAVSGPGPDTVVMPSPLAVGDYRLCTANSAPEACVDVQVVAG